MEPQDAVEILSQLKEFYLEQIAIAESIIQQAKEGIEHVNALLEGVARMSEIQKSVNKSIQKNPQSNQQ